MEIPDHPGQRSARPHSGKSAEASGVSGIDLQTTVPRTGVQHIGISESAQGGTPLGSCVVSAELLFLGSGDGYLLHVSQPSQEVLDVTRVFQSELDLRIRPLLS